MSVKDKTRPRGRPKASGIRKLSKSVTVKFSRIDYERLLHRKETGEPHIGGVHPGSRIRSKDCGQAFDGGSSRHTQSCGNGEQSEPACQAVPPDRILPDKECRHGTARKAESDHERI